MSENVYDFGEYYKSYYKYYLHVIIDKSDSIQFTKLLNEQKTRINTDDIPYRVLSHWEKQGILGASRDSSKGWRKYSFVEGIWLLIIQKLRNFNYSLDKIRDVRYLLMNYPEEVRFKNNLITEYPLLELYLQFVFQKKKIVLIGLESGGLFPVEYNDYLDISNHLSHHLIIDFNGIVSEFRNRNNYEFIKEDVILDEITKKEKRILDILRDNKCIEMKFIKGNGEVDRVVKTMEKELDERVHEIMKDSGYQDIHYKIREHGVVKVISEQIEKL